MERQGYEVDLAVNGCEAVEAISKAHYAVVLLDCMMPVVDGPEMLRLMREDERLLNVPVVMMSAAEMRRQVQALGCSAFLKKPFDLNTLLQTVARLVSDGGNREKPGSV